MPATIRFVGQTEFARGMWVGLELDAYEGRYIVTQRYYSSGRNKECRKLNLLTILFHDGKLHI